MLLRMSVTVRGTGIYLSLYTATLSVREAIFHVERAIPSIGLFQRQHSVAGRPGSFPVEYYSSTQPSQDEFDASRYYYNREDQVLTAPSSSKITCRPRHCPDT